ncbi:Hypothetical predicted protein [Marmota monax]|uniref:Uncharacterized protein n=1 Tax=Marmota monax TaxID=9995 RepID=A0A5E4CGU1_MARMO|nr:hypothetical protein GHT09_008127 [Marmota monax]VTJ81025.1 Hypothetical predicted protein [Marmota monax]
MLDLSEENTDKQHLEGELSGSPDARQWSLTQQFHDSVMSLKREEMEAGLGSSCSSSSPLWIQIIFGVRGVFKAREKRQKKFLVQMLMEVKSVRLLMWRIIQEAKKSLVIMEIMGMNAPVRHGILVQRRNKEAVATSLENREDMEAQEGDKMKKKQVSGNAGETDQEVMYFFYS